MGIKRDFEKRNVAFDAKVDGTVDKLQTKTGKWTGLIVTGIAVVVTIVILWIVFW